MRSRAICPPAGLAAVLATSLFAGLATGSDPAVVRIKDYRFEPARLEVRAGTTVRWVNEEKRASHSIHFLEERLPESERLLGGDTWERRFDRPGTYPYVCGPHPEMRGVIEVRP